MQETERYKLKKPDADDFFDIEDFNENTDKIEQALKENAEGVKELKAPSFDDTGTVSDINSFTDFINSVKSRMNIFEFFKNFKAGLKYIVHQGQIINSQDVTQAGFALDARQANPNISGTLGAKISDLNNNIHFAIDAEGSPNSLEDAIKSVWEKLPRGKYFSGNLWYSGVYTINGFVYPNGDYGAVTAFSFAHPLLTVQCLNNNFSSEKYVTNSDLVSYLGVPDYKNAVTLSDNIQTYTAPSNGYIKSNMYRYDTTITYWIIVSINNKSVWIFNGNASKLSGTMFLPVAKGDIIKWNYEDTSCGTNSNLFIPCK